MARRRVHVAQLEILARLYAREDLTAAQRRMVLDDYRAEAIEMGEIDLNARTGEGMRAHGTVLVLARKPMRRAVPRPPIDLPGRAVHGTTHSYNLGCRCRACNAAKSEASRRARERRAARRLA